MINVMKMTIFRMIKSKSFYIILAVLVVFALFTTFGYSAMEEAAMTPEMQQQLAELNNEGENINLGLSFYVDSSTLTLQSLLEAFFTSGIIVLFTGIFMEIGRAHV